MNQLSFVQAYGLDPLLTVADDPLLWEAALRRHWTDPGNPECLVDALRFNIGRRLAPGELPQGETNTQHYNMRGLVDIEEWCFERVGALQLAIKPCLEPAAPAPIQFPGMGLAAIMSGQSTFSTSVQVVRIYLGFSRPSLGSDQAIVYSATSAPGVGEGNAFIWQRKLDGQWQQSADRAAWWIT
jgi:hypothetical protein